MMNEQNAIKLEIVARRALNIKHKDGMAGTISKDFILHNNGAFTIICASLAPYYLHATSEQRIILDSMIENYRILNDCDKQTYFKMIALVAEELRNFLNELGVQDAD
ncbi:MULTISPECIES: hypothetical protein [Paraliobacillus]|uniref:hypothetical protein n=1 Tax=Paraliobacillus TaxID=200903 RepID=UPI000DD2C766|nr:MULTISPECIES: hypothetical protein [Paraliobacillus]